MATQRLNNRPVDLSFRFLFWLQTRLLWCWLVVPSDVRVVFSRRAHSFRPWHHPRSLVIACSTEERQMCLFYQYSSYFHFDGAHEKGICEIENQFGSKQETAEWIKNFRNWFSGLAPSNLHFHWLSFHSRFYSPSRFPSPRLDLGLHFEFLLCCLDFLVFLRRGRRNGRK